MIHGVDVFSPNCDTRPAGSTVCLVVVHAISLPPNRFGGDSVERLFTNTLDPDAHPFFREVHHLRVSAHYFIRRNGELIGFVPPEMRAWHAGVSSWRGRERCNDFSVGIELEGCDILPFEPIQYEVLAKLIVSLCDCFPISGVAGHSDIAPGRKTDPGPMFAWGRLKRILEAREAVGVSKLIEPEIDAPEDEQRRMAWPFPLVERPD